MVKSSGNVFLFSLYIITKCIVGKALHHPLIQIKKKILKIGIGKKKKKEKKKKKKKKIFFSHKNYLLVIRYKFL